MCGCIPYITPGLYRRHQPVPGQHHAQRPRGIYCGHHQPQRSRLVQAGAQRRRPDLLRPGSGEFRVYFGIDRLPSDTVECVNHINDVRICPQVRREAALMNTAAITTSAGPCVRTAASTPRTATIWPPTWISPGYHDHPGGRKMNTPIPDLRQRIQCLQHGHGDRRAASAGLRP